MLSPLVLFFSNAQFKMDSAIRLFLILFSRSWRLLAALECAWFRSVIIAGELNCFHPSFFPT